MWQRDLIYAGGRLLGAVKNGQARPSVSLAAAGVSVNEGVASQTATVAVPLTTAAPLACAVSVSYQTWDATATAGQMP